MASAVPPPAARPLGRTTGVPRPVCPGCGRCGCGDPAPAPRRAPLRAGVARRDGGGGASPGGVPSAVVRGVWGQPLLLPRLPALWAGCRGPLPTGCGCGGVRAWGPITIPSARALASWLCALWGRHKSARGGRLLPGCGASGAGRSPSPDCPPSGPAAGAHYPLAVGAGGCRRGDPSPTPQRALLRAGFARCGASTRVPGGGASCLGVGRPGPGALPPPTDRPLGGLPGPTTHWLWVRGGAGVGTRHQPHSALSCLLRGRHEGAQGGRLLPGCGASGVGRSPTPDCPPSGRAAGAHYPLAVGAGEVRAWGPGTNPTARALASWLCALWGQHEGARGGRLLPGCGASGVGRSPGPDCPPSGRAAGAHYPLAVGAGGCGRGDPSPTPQRALLRAVGAARGCPGGAPLAWVWGVRGRALSHPRLPALWAGCRGPLPTGCGPGRCGHGDPSPTPQRALLRAGFARCGGGTRAPGGGASCLGEGRPRSGALSSPTDRPLGGLPGPTTHWLWARGGGRHGDPSPTPQRAPLRAGFARCGGSTRAPGGGASCLGVGRLGSGALPPPTARPLGGLPGPTTHWLWVRGGAGVGTRHRPHSALVLRAVGAA